MVTLQILVLPFLVRVRVAQQKEEVRKKLRAFLLVYVCYGVSDPFNEEKVLVRYKQKCLTRMSGEALLSICSRYCQNFGVSMGLSRLPQILELCLDCLLGCWKRTASVFCLLGSNQRLLLTGALDMVASVFFAALGRTILNLPAEPVR